ncbi:interphotoreceptor matrix proteoglycan 2 [Odontesthes bonariensis]|uniref:interphotoreceptor matrix proteoglycan 2 n=1 Tax=Odontesthes bonariensis TaxID=219752 RepID=UPI003F583D27
MGTASRKGVIYSVLFTLVVIFFNRWTDATLEGSSMGYLAPPHARKPGVFPHIIRVSDVKASPEGQAVISRQKRNIFYQSGLQLCGEETVEQVVANHLSYFHLRVCQETVWEAFKIFWAHIPEQEEYQSWMSQCQQGTVTAGDIGIYFSQSEQHHIHVKQVMSHAVSPPGPGSTCADDLNHLEDEGKERKGDDVATISAEVKESPLFNDITLQPTAATELEQVVELSILLSGETFSDELNDPASLKFQTLSRDVAEKIEEALEGVPGFKSLSVIDFRPQKDTQGPDGIVVDYAVTVVVEGAGMSSEQLNYLTLQSNLVEDSYRKIEERSTVAYTIAEAKNLFTEALHINELESVFEIPAPISTADRATVTAADELPEVLTLEEDTGDDILPEPSETNTAATEEDVVVMEESEIVPPTVTVTTNAPETGSIEEEGLLPENTLETPTAETPLPEELPPEDPTPDLPASAPLPESPLEIETSGSGPHELDILSEPPTDATEDVEVSLEETTSEDGEVSLEETTSEDGEVSLEETTSEDGLITEEISISTEDSSEDGEKVAAVEEETATEKHKDEVLVNETEGPEVLEISTVAIETTEEDSLPALVPLSEAVDIKVEVSEPDDAAETVLFPDADNPVVWAPEASDLPVPPASEDVNPEQPEENAANIVVLTQPEETSFEEESSEEATENEGVELKEDTSAEAPVVDEEAEQVPKISTEDLTEDDILLVNINDPEPLVTDSPAPPQPTVLSPEMESPFTLISDIGSDSEGQPDTDMPSLEETSHEDLEDATTGDHGYDVASYGHGLTNHTEEGSTGFPFSVAHGTDLPSVAMPVNPGRALMVFFSLRVTNMIFSEDLFNKSSAEYKALEQRFLELLVPYLQSNLSHFENLEILNFRNGSIVVNSRMKFGKPVARGVTTTVYLILEDFCNTAYQTMNLAIDKYSLDVESGDQADPCKFQACNEYAECKVNKWSGEAECVCNAGYFSVDGLPCQSICELQTDFCLNDGKCDIIPGQGAICRCRVGENWWYRGEHCEEYVSEPLVVGIAIASVAGFLLVASGVLFFLARTLRDQYDKDESEDHIRRAESLPSLERATKYNPMYESEATMGYSHYYRRYPEAPVFSSASVEASTDFSSEEIRHIYENSELTKEEIQDRIRIIELYAKDRQFADFVRHHQAVVDTRRESSTT